MASSIKLFQSKETTITADKKARWLYWALTVPFVVTMMMAGVTYLMGASFNVEGITHLGYPAYVCKILGTGKLLGGIAILFGRSQTLMPRQPIGKEGARGSLP
jgi:hypothetical protein